jgi:Soluble NSF attachment protein, SNAP
MATGEGFAGWAKKACKEGKFAECADFYRRAAEVFDSVGDFMRGAHAARHQAEALLKTGDPSGASECIQGVVRFYRGREVGQPEMANALRVAALAEESLSHAKEALEYWAEAREGYLAEGMEAGVVECDQRLKMLGAD